MTVGYGIETPRVDDSSNGISPKTACEDGNSLSVLPVSRQRQQRKSHIACVRGLPNVPARMDVGLALGIFDIDQSIAFNARAQQFKRRFSKRRVLEGWIDESNVDRR